MNAVRRCFDFFLNSPTYGRDRAHLISGFSIGTAGLLLNGAVLFLVVPLLLTPDGVGFGRITDTMEFGQLLAMILLGGATAFATLLIPLRLVTVFWEPRSGRYFDQIVLSGISPLRFVIGKAVSQNLFLGLILFLLLPYLTLSLTLGGVDLGFFAAGLFLVWLYCMELALVTLWVSLYLNELLAAVLVIIAATSVAVDGCLPWQFQPFVMTPFPALIQPFNAQFARLNDIHPADFWQTFGACAACMSVIVLVSLSAIALGPLYGIIRENSTFGEVVRAGDNKRRRWFRIRMHIQRSSEIAFFYENRSSVFLASEGLLRWGAGLCGLIVLFSASCAAFVCFTAGQWVLANLASTNWLVFEFHTIYLSIHGTALAIAVILFSHSKNTTYQRIPFFRGRTAEVSTLDTRAFLLFAAFSTAAAIAMPFLLQKYIVAPNGLTVFPDHIAVFPDQIEQQVPGYRIDFVRIAIEGPCIVTLAGLVVYALQRLTCLSTWSRSVTTATVAAIYSFFFCGLPLFFAVLCVAARELGSVQWLADWATTVAVTSPVPAMAVLFNGQIGPGFAISGSTIPFYVSHIVALCLILAGIRRSGRKLRQMYLTEAPVETVYG